MKTLTPDQAKEIQSCAPVKKDEANEAGIVDTSEPTTSGQSAQLTQAQAEHLAAQSIQTLIRE